MYYKIPTVPELAAPSPPFVALLKNLATAPQHRLRVVKAGRGAKPRLWTTSWLGSHHWPSRVRRGSVGYEDWRNVRDIDELYMDRYMYMYIYI